MQIEVVLLLLCGLSLTINGILVIAINNLFRCYRWLTSDFEDMQDESLQMNKDITGIKQYLAKTVTKDDLHKEVFTQVNKRILEGVIKWLHLYYLYCMHFMHLGGYGC